MKVIQIMRTRVLSGNAPITGNSRVILSDSMEISTMMITSAAMSAVRKPPIRFVPPTISAIGRAISEKLIVAPPIAMSMTNAETKKLTSDDDDSTDSARSWSRTMSSYSSMSRSIVTERFRRLSTFLLT